MGARDQVTIIGITAPSRVSDAPDAPTLKEQGYDVQFVNWRGFFGPPGMSNADKSCYCKNARRCTENSSMGNCQSKKCMGKYL
jgi:putative tricarboxylic transport membrane protein